MAHCHRGKSSESFIDKDIILHELNILPDQTILDAGCGNGYMSKEFSRILNNTAKVYALDPDREAIETLKKKTKGTNIETIVADITKKTPIEEASIDLIYLSTVIHGFQENQISSFKKEVKRLLKPNALLAIVEIEKKDTPFGPPLNIRFSPEELTQTINLYPKSFLEIGQYFYMQVFENRYIKASPPPLYKA
ncbi:MAG: class I SAM-dependent methyltransferase [Thermodesulfobacteriota bacterium]|nr:class I SAM-dependent methyltransferase [Thermodesulfobacteriota bacterium]